MGAVAYKISQPGAPRASSDMGTESGAFARYSLISAMCRDAQDLDFCHKLSRLFDLTECQAHDRAEVEAFISETFALAYQAQVRRFMPRLLGICTKEGGLLAAFGVRSAAHEKLFLESYLDAPIEQVIEARVGIKPQRGRVVEIGNLAAVYPGAVRWMIVAMTVMLYEEGYEWVTFTGTAALRNGFNKLGLHPIEICPARAESLDAEERARWGSYYQHQPIVMFGNIRAGFQAMRANENLLEILSGEKESFFRVLHTTKDATP